MTKTFATDDNNDLFISADDRLTIYDGLMAVLQNCEHAAKTVLNEMVLAQGEGLPYFTWAGTPNLPVWEAAFRARILGVADVLQVVTLRLVVEGEVLKYTAEIQTIYGTGLIPNG